MNVLGFVGRCLAYRSRETLLGVLGVAITGMLLLDMLMLSRGIVVSFGDILERLGFDLRVTSDENLATIASPLLEASRIESSLRGVAGVEDVVGLLYARSEVLASGKTVHAGLLGVTGPARNQWRLVAGRDLRWSSDQPTVVVNEFVAEQLGVEPGDEVRVRGRCAGTPEAIPSMVFRVAGIAKFLLEPPERGSVVTRLPDLHRACETERRDAVDVFFIASSRLSTPEDVADSIRSEFPQLHVETNREVLERLRRTDFSYFAQVAFALSATTLVFGAFLVASIVTFSVNQRRGEIAGLRTIGVTRERAVGFVASEVALVVAFGGVLAVPLAGVTALWLDGILRALPGLPEGIRFFVPESRTFLIYGVELLLTAGLASLYPAYLIARLPLADTLRKETIG